MVVPFVNLALQYSQYKTEIDEALFKVLSSGSYLGGSHVNEFENSFAEKCHAAFCVSLGNATSGLFLALKALGIGPGDEVITPAWSWISTSEVISLCGAKPVFADVDSDHYTITESEIRNKTTDKTKAVIAVHLYGQSAEVSPIKNLCGQHNLHLIEDCSQAHLSKETDSVLGTIGDVGVFSFYPTKNLGAYGDGGCAITNNKVIADKIRRFANHGGLIKDEHQIEGFNSRLGTLQAAVLNVKLKYLEGWNQRRIEIAAMYTHRLKNLDQIKLPLIRQNTTHTFHQYVIRTERRDELKNFLAHTEIQTMIHYPKALPFEPAYEYLNHSEKDFPVSAELQKTVLSLPIYPELTNEQVEYVCSMIKSFYDTRD